MPIGENEVKVELDFGEPPQFVLDYARENFGETPETRWRKLDEFRDYIFEKEEVYPHRTDDAFLLRFLRARKFQIPPAYRLLCRYYKFKENNPHLHRDINPNDLLQIGTDGVISVPANRDQNGRRLLIFRAGPWDPSQYGVDEIFQATVITLELGIMEPRAQILGGVCIIDLKGLTLTHAWQLTPSLAMKMVEYIVGCLTMKIEAIHIMHQSWIFDIVYNVFKPLTSSKMREKVYFHGDDFESLHSHIDPKYLPIRYGGTQDDLNHNLWLEWFRTKRGVVEELRLLGYIIDDSETRFDDIEPSDKLGSSSSDNNGDPDSEHFTDCESDLSA